MKKLATFVISFFLFITLSGLSAYVMLTYVLRGEEVEVPALVGQNVVTAVQTLQEGRLHIQILERERSNSVPKDIIVKQMPAAGERVKQGRSILVTLSAGITQVLVPRLEGELLLNAKSLLQQHELTIGHVSMVASPLAAANRVLAQSPQSGQEVVKGGSVNLLISLGEPNIAYGMPELIGKPLDQAMAVVKALRLEVGDLAYARYPGLPAGAILVHLPRAGEPVQPGSKVRFTVSKAPAVSEQVGTFSVLQYQVPEGLSARKLRVLINSEKGTREVYNKVSEPGKDIRLLIPVHGKTTAKIFLDEKLVGERIYY